MIRCVLNRLLWLGYGLLIAGSSFADENVPAKMPSSGEGFLNTGFVFQLIGALLLVLICIFVVVVVIRRINIGYIGGKQHIRVISSISVGPREKLLLVEVGTQQVLVGSTPTSIQRLHQLDEPVDASMPEATGFSSILGSLSGSSGNPALKKAGSDSRG